MEIGALAAPIRQDTGHLGPEAWRMVWYKQVTKLVHHHVIENIRGR